MKREFEISQGRHRFAAALKVFLKKIFISSFFNNKFKENILTWLQFLKRNSILH